jgi:hypothetical protein
VAHSASPRLKGSRLTSMWPSKDITTGQGQQCESVMEHIQVAEVLYHEPLSLFECEYYKTHPVYALLDVRPL